MGRQCRGGVGRERTANSKDTGSLPVVLYCMWAVSLCCPEWPQTPELKWSSSEGLSSHGSQLQVYAAIPRLLLRSFGFLFLKHDLNTGSW